MKQALSYTKAVQNIKDIQQPTKKKAFILEVKCFARQKIGKGKKWVHFSLGMLFIASWFSLISISDASIINESIAPFSIIALLLLLRAIGPQKDYFTAYNLVSKDKDAIKDL